MAILDGQQNAIALVSLIDRPAVNQIKVIAAALAKRATTSRPIDYYVLLTGPATDFAGKFLGLQIGPVQTHPIPCSNPWAARSGAVSAAALLKLALPDLLPDLDRAIFLDWDVLPRRDIAELWATDLGENLVGAVRDYPQWPLHNFKTRIDKPRFQGTIEEYFRLRLFLDPEIHAETYINSGVMLMDLAGLRKSGFVDQAASVIEEREASLLWQDQDILNIVLAGRFLLLDPRWNAMPMSVRRRDFSGAPPAIKAAIELQLSDPWLVHFANFRKPWTHDSDDRYFAEWWEVAGELGIAAELRADREQAIARRREKNRNPFVAARHLVGHLAREWGIKR